MYRLLVSSERVPAWKPAYIKSIAHHEHLYTRIVGGAQSDEFERWIEAQFESPAASAIEAAAAGRRLSKDDWWNLVRLLAAQDVRTPARLFESMKRWCETVPQMIEEITQSAVRASERGSLSKQRRSQVAPEYSSYLPIRVSTHRNEDGDGGVLRVETDVGRGYWLFQMKHLLTQTTRVLHEHRWSLMVPPDDIEWVTSDDPVVKLNFHTEAQFDFGGGWASPGSEILMPLGPKRLMYTRIGEKNMPREVRIDTSRAQLINRIIIGHAHRAIFATQPVDAVESFRPRLVDPTIVEQEKRRWSEWAAEAQRSNLPSEPD